MGVFVTLSMEVIWSTIDRTLRVFLSLEKEELTSDMLTGRSLHWFLDIMS